MGMMATVKFDLGQIVCAAAVPVNYKLTATGALCRRNSAF